MRRHLVEMCMRMRACITKDSTNFYMASFAQMRMRMFAFNSPNEFYSHSIEVQSLGC